MGLLFFVLVFLWNWDGPTQVESTETASNNTATTQPETTPATPAVQQPVEPVVQEPVAPAFPYTITLPEGASDRESVGTDVEPAYRYTFADGALMTVYPEGRAAALTDIEWQYSSDADGKVTILQRLDQLCAAGTTGCSAGNGKIEITVVPTVAADKLVVFITDSNIATKTPAQAAVQYEAIVNTIRLAQ